MGNADRYLLSGIGALDSLLFLWPFGSFLMPPPADYFADIGLTYLMIPIIALLSDLRSADERFFMHSTALSLDFAARSIQNG